MLIIDVNKTTSFCIVVCDSTQIRYFWDFDSIKFD